MDVLLPIVVAYDVLALKKCNESTPYSIHGLWPQWDPTNWPQFCDNSSRFDSSLIAPWRSQMEGVWYSCYGDEEQFWAHEWSKHGTCSGLEQGEYFATAIFFFHFYPWECSSNQTQCLVVL